MAVTKNQPVSAVTECVEAGLSLFGENRVQEAQEKYAAVGGNAELHLIGHLQRNKAKAVPELFSAVQSIDAERTLSALSKVASASGKEIDVYVEVNTSGEASKHGVTDDAELFALVESAMAFGVFRVRGLMTIAPFTKEEAVLRRSFGRLYELREQCWSRFPDLGLIELSMGMTNDYQIAVEEGSTMVRIGTGLFGARTYGLS